MMNVFFYNTRPNVDGTYLLHSYCIYLSGVASSIGLSNGHQINSFHNIFTIMCILYTAQVDTKNILNTQVHVHTHICLQIHTFAVSQFYNYCLSHNPFIGVSPHANVSLITQAIYTHVSLLIL